MIVFSVYNLILSIIDDGVNGLLFPAGDVGALVDRLKRLETDTDLRNTLITGGRKTIATKYDWNKIADRTLTIFEECLYR